DRVAGEPSVHANGANSIKATFTGRPTFNQSSKASPPAAFATRPPSKSDKSGENVSQTLPSWFREIATPARRFARLRHSAMRGPTGVHSRLKKGRVAMKVSTKVRGGNLAANRKQEGTVNRNIAWVVRGVIVLSATLMLTVGVVEAQTGGRIAM